jgi:hypothetical protein
VKSEDTPREREQVSRWVELANVKKQIFDWPDWVLHTPRTGDGHQSTDQFVLTVLLSDESGAAIEGLQLRIVVWRDRPNEDATALLIVEDGDGWTTISRLDCWPISPHENKFWRHLKEPPQVDGSHVHGCASNARFGRRAFKPYENLPSAMGVDSEPHSFRDMMRLVERLFNISGAAELPAPDWQQRLL